MIFGIGTDIVKVQRISDDLKKYGDRFAQKILSDSEFSEFSDYSNQGAFLAKRFAAKEAAVKALGTGFRNGISMKHISVGHDELGKPILEFSGVANEVIQEKNIISSHLSIADENDFAVAYVVLER